MSIPLLFPVLPQSFSLIPIAAVFHLTAEPDHEGIVENSPQVCGKSSSDS